MNSRPCITIYFHKEFAGPQLIRALAQEIFGYSIIDFLLLQAPELLLLSAQRSGDLVLFGTIPHFL